MDIFKEIAEKHEAGHTFVLATMVRTQGSSPRDIGAKMLVFPDGSISGTIGGGNFEKMVIDDCLSLFTGSGQTAAQAGRQGARALLKTYRFSRSGPDATGMCCGGEADVFMELFAPSERLVIFGGGHIARDLVKIATDLDFRITVIDDRQETLSQYQKPVETILTDSEYEESLPSLDENCHVVIVTRSHTIDRKVLAKVIHENVAYLGMIGSKTKVSETVSFLKAYGIDDSLLGKVHTPIGLDIGAEGPYQIALSIAAELIAIRRKTAQSC
jgi:xanthine dehydrogenase accessory factor